MLAHLMDISIPPFLRRFIIYCGVGFFNTVIGFVFIMFFYKILDFYYLLANFIGYMLSVIVGYWTHRNITFRDKRVAGQEWIDILKHIRKFSFVFTVSYLMQLFSLYLLVDFFGFWVVFAQILAMLVYIGMSYAGTNIITFKKV